MSICLIYFLKRFISLLWFFIYFQRISNKTSAVHLLYLTKFSTLISQSRHFLLKLVSITLVNRVMRNDWCCHTNWSSQMSGFCMPLSQPDLAWSRWVLRIFSKFFFNKWRLPPKNLSYASKDPTNTMCSYHGDRGKRFYLALKIICPLHRWSSHQNY